MSDSLTSEHFSPGNNQYSQVAAFKYQAIPLLKTLWGFHITCRVEPLQCAHPLVPLCHRSPDICAKPSSPHSPSKSTTLHGTAPSPQASFPHPRPPPFMLCYPTHCHPSGLPLLPCAQQVSISKALLPLSSSGVLKLKGTSPSPGNSGSLMCISTSAQVILCC